MHRNTRSASVVLMMALMTMGALAQNPPATTTAPLRPAAFDPASIREFMMGRLRAEVGATDAEWKLLEPKIVKVTLLQLDVSNMGNIMRGRGGPMAGGMAAFMRMVLDPNALPSQVEEKSRELQETIDNTETSTDLYKTRLAQLRKAREKAKEDLAAAQKELAALLTLRQEARLVQLGLLD